MKPYYKRGGFFDRLERLSTSIDLKIDMYLLMLKTFGILYYVPFFRRLAVIANFIDHCADSENYYAVARINTTDLYNQEKYWWMREK